MYLRGVSAARLSVRSLESGSETSGGETNSIFHLPRPQKMCAKSGCGARKKNLNLPGDYFDGNVFDDDTGRCECLPSLKKKIIERINTDSKNSAQTLIATVEATRNKIHSREVIRTFKKVSPSLQNVYKLHYNKTIPKRCQKFVPFFLFSFPRNCIG